jgi:hypothetical protein
MRYGVHIALVAAALLSARCSAPPKVAADPRVEELARQAYLYGVAPVQYRLMRWRNLHDPAARFRMPLNEFQHGRLLAHPESNLVTPNNDVLTSQAYLTAGDAPLVLHVPASPGRYISVQLVDAFTNSYAYFDKPGTYTLRLPTRSVWALARTECDGRGDLPAARSVQDGLTLTSPKPLNHDPGQEVALDLEKEPLLFFELLNRCLTENPPPESEAALMREFGYIRVGPGLTFDPSRLAEPVRKGMINGMAAAREQLAVRLKQREGRVNGWEMPPKNQGKYGTDYELRAATALTELGAGTPEETMFPGTNEDSAGRTLDGQFNYALHFDKGETPPVEAFWSLTIYRLPSFALVPNNQWKFSLGSRTEGLRRSADGSLELSIQRANPGGEREANWLPAPPGAFFLVMRMYRPKQALVDGVYKLPAVRRVD